MGQAMTRLEEIEARLNAATPGPWEYGDRYSICGVMPRMFGEGKCSSCSRHGEPDWVGRLDINGTKMLAHVHIMDKPWSHSSIVHYDGNGNLYSVVIETDEYGLMDTADAAFIAASRTDVPYLLNLVASLTAERDALRDRYEPLRSWADGAEIDIRDLADQRADLRGELAQRDEELTALREKVRAVYELVTLFDYTAIYDLKCDLLAALSDNQEGRKSGTVPVYGHGVVLAEDGDTLWFLSDSGSHWSVRRDVMTWDNKVGK